MNRLIYLLLLFTLPIAAAAQTTFGSVKGRVTDKTTGDPIGFAAVVLQNGKYLVTQTTTDDDGNYYLSAVKPGTYDLMVHMLGYNKTVITDVKIEVDKVEFINVGLVSVELGSDSTIIFTGERIQPLVAVGEKHIDNIVDDPNRNNLGKILNKAPNVNSFDGGPLYIGGTRAGSIKYQLDGVNMINGVNMPARAMQSIDVITNGVSAEYGDFLGGVVNFITPLPSSQSVYAIEGMSSSLFDKYHYNSLEAFASGPLYIKNKGRKDGQEVKMGYTLAANFNYQADRQPSAIQVWKVKDEKLKELEANPIRSAPKGGLVPSAEFITINDLQKVTANQNIPAYTLAIVGNLNFALSKKSQLVLGGKYDYNNVINYIYQNNLFNTANNPQSISNGILAYASYTNRLIDPENKKQKGPITNAYYNIRFDYQSNWNVTQDAEHRDNLFDYGYVGRFRTYSTPAYEYRNTDENSHPDSFLIDNKWVYIKNYYRQSGNRMVDTMVTFDRSNTRNPLRANYTSLYYDLLGQDNINSLFDIRGSNAGLVNGQNPIGIYSYMWNNVGTGYASYTKSQNEQYGLNAIGEMSIKSHDLKFGMYYEQRVQRGYNVNANGLWQLAWQLMNNGIEADTKNPILVTDGNGIFQDTVKFNYRQNESQSTFDKNFRANLMSKGAVDNYGKPITETSFVDVNSYDPKDLSLSYFSADELLNNGNKYVDYYGYDYLGNKLHGHKSIQDFTNNTQNRYIGAYMPIYAAAFVQDQVILRDKLTNIPNFILRAGLRVERFDNNMPVLKDPFSLFPIKTAGEVKTLNGNQFERPSNIGDNYAVYVNDAQNPTQVTGYRNGTDWYNASGSKIADPSQIAVKSKGGNIQPYLSDPKNQKVTAASFIDYKPQWMALPRLYLDFPINDKARFFASYDVLAQRPVNNFATIDDYYYMPFNPTDVVGNPNLKPQRTTDYEVGYRQRVSEKSSIGLIATYREQRNLVQLYRYNYAYPVSYTSFANIDFATVKSFTAEYLYRIQKRLDMNASYTLQFADGTGSSALSQQSLVAVGLPNLRTAFPMSFDIRHNIKLNAYYTIPGGDEYKGPVIGKKFKVFENTGLSLSLNAFSGVPYTATALPQPTQQNIASRSPIKGTPFGSRTPWMLQNDISVFKNFMVKLGTKDGKPKSGMLKVSLAVNNFLNFKGTKALHSYTGSASTDGWLESAQGKKAAEAAVNAQSFIDLYNISLANPGMYMMPRRARLAIALTF